MRLEHFWIAHHGMYVTSFGSELCIICGSKRQRQDHSHSPTLIDVLRQLVRLQCKL